MEDVFPIENGDIPASYLSLLEGTPKKTSDLDGQSQSYPTQRVKTAEMHVFCFLWGDDVNGHKIFAHPTSMCT